MAFCCWRSLRKNEWFELPLNVGLKYCNRPNQVDPHVPGPMAFKDQDRVNNIISASGFTNVSIKDHKSKLVVGPTPKMAANNSIGVGPLSWILQNFDNHIKALVQTELEKQLMQNVTSQGV
ncbi:hypothetical protein N9F34_04675 [Alphaproteobacteria bacterium]|nr:hypothetical protein [Alphaproteobacteria bacterium]